MQFKRIYIKDFQSIKELELVLEENKCYHIRGNNNIGKSSLLKALEAVIKNISSRNVKNFIRDGAESFYVEVSDFDNNVVRLSRGEEDYYSWDIAGDSGRVDTTAGKVPDEVRKHFNMYEDLDKTKEIINIRPPRAKLLFVDTTFSENYYLLQKALRIEEYLSAIKLGNSKKTEYKKAIQLYADRVKDENSELGELKDYSVLINELKDYENAFDNYYEKIVDIEYVLDLHKSIELKEHKLKEMSFSFDKDYAKNLVDKIKLIDDILIIKKEIFEKEKRIEKMKLIVEEFEKSSSIYKQLIDLNENKALCDKVNSLNEGVTRIESRISSSKEIITNWETLDVSNKVKNINSSVYIIDVGKKLREDITQLNEKKSEYDRKEEERKEFMVENKFCPVVLSMRDKKCPFSNKTLVELLEN